MFPKTIGDGRTRTRRRRHDGEPLPVVRTNLLIRVVAAGLVTIVPNGPRPRFAGSTITDGGRPARGPRRGRAGIGVWIWRIRIRSIRPGRKGETNNNGP